MLTFSNLLESGSFIGGSPFTAAQVAQHRRNWVRDPSTGRIVSRDELERNQSEPQQQQPPEEPEHDTVASLD